MNAACRPPAGIPRPSRHERRDEEDADDRPRIAEGGSDTRELPPVALRDELREHGVVRRQGELVGRVRDGERSEEKKKAATRGDAGVREGREREGRAGADQRQADDPGFAAPRRVGDGADPGREEKHRHRGEAGRHRVRGVGRPALRHEPDREVQGHDVHRENRVGEVVQGPAPALPGRGRAPGPEGGRRE